MDSDTKFLDFRHAREVREKWNAARGLPFQKILSGDAVAKALLEEGIEFRERVFSPDVTLWTFLSQILSEDQSCQRAVAQLIAFLAARGEKVPSANTAAYCKARARLPEKLISNMARESGRRLEEEVPTNWLWRGRHVKLVDGSTITMPDTKENQAAYPQVPAQKKGLGFPIARLVTIISYSTGALIDLSLGSYYGKGSGEHSLLRELLHNFQSGDVALGDAYYCSFFLIAWLQRRGVDVLFPMYGYRKYDFRSGERLGKKDHLARWIKPPCPDWMDEETYTSFPQELSLREVEVSFDRQGFRTQKRVLVTTFLNPKKINKIDLRNLYDQRWLVEIALKAIKETMHMDILRGKTPQMVRKEIWMHLFAYNLIRKVMAQASRVHGKNPKALSFKLALQIIEAFRTVGMFHENKPTNYHLMLNAIAYRNVGNRPGRSEPRHVKRRPKRFPLLQKLRRPQPCAQATA